METEQRFMSAPATKKCVDLPLGAWKTSYGTSFRVWAPFAEQLQLLIANNGQSPICHSLEKDSGGIFSVTLPEILSGTCYSYLVDGKGPFPDPASRYQPNGVHGPSQVIDPSRFHWTDGDWRGIHPRDVVLYELHVGTFSPEGTFAGATARLPLLKVLGVTAIELMPVADFAGERGWGYDGVHLFAPAHMYGTPDDLRQLVNEAHALGLAVLFDVVYNHFGPAGDYTSKFSPYYFSRTRTNPWGKCVNLDEEGSSHVRTFFLQNALHWVHEYHVDGLRLDATHALLDNSQLPFVAELVETVRSSCPEKHLLITAEDHRNLATMITSAAQDGWGLDGVWADDFHHQIRRILTDENESYFADFSENITDLCTTLNKGWFYTGQWSEHSCAFRGTDPGELDFSHFIVCIQNHDQVGNRALGERLHHQVHPAAYRAASALLLTAPQTPLLFMGQEWACSSPFLYFTDHSPELGKLIVEGRRKEFEAFAAFTDPESRTLIPDPQDLNSFLRSKLDWSELQKPFNSGIYSLYQILLAFRKEEIASHEFNTGRYRAFPLGDDVVALRYCIPEVQNLSVIVRLRGSGTVQLPRVENDSSWHVLLSTEDKEFSLDPRPPKIRFEREWVSITFHCPSAIILKERFVRSRV